MDIWTEEKRSRVMSRIKSKNTTPEKRVRIIVRKNGFRYSLHNKKLPGKPDIVLSGLKKVIFVHGCFWHQHKKCRDGTLPKTQNDYWKNKFDKNIKRDKEHIKQLKKAGWKTLVIWECEVEKTPGRVEKKIVKYLQIVKR